MVKYINTHGTTVRNSAGNLSGVQEGELFYNSTTNDFKYQYPSLTATG